MSLTRRQYIHTPTHLVSSLNKKTGNSVVFEVKLTTKINSRRTGDAIRHTKQEENNLV